MSCNKVNSAGQSEVNESQSGISGRQQQENHQVVPDYVTLINIANWQLITCVYIKSKPIIVLWKTPKISFITVHEATCPIPHWLLMREI